MASPSGGSPSNFAGLPWSVWAENVPLTPEIVSESEKPKDKLKTNEQVTDHMPRTDRLLFGTCPSQDEFYLVVCEKCGQVIKPQALRTHLEKHISPRRGSSSSSSVSSRRVVKPFNSETLTHKASLHTKASVKEKPLWAFNTSPRLRDKYDLIKGSRARKNCRVNLENIVNIEKEMGKSSPAISEGSVETIVNGPVSSSQDTLILSDSSQELEQVKVTGYSNGLGSTGSPALTEPDADRLSSSDTEVQNRENSDCVDVEIVSSEADIQTEVVETETDQLVPASSTLSKTIEDNQILVEILSQDSNEILPESKLTTESIIETIAATESISGYSETSLSKKSPVESKPILHSWTDIPPKPPDIIMTDDQPIVIMQPEIISLDNQSEFVSIDDPITTLHSSLQSQYAVSNSSSNFKATLSKGTINNLTNFNSYNITATELPPLSMTYPTVTSPPAIVSKSTGIAHKKIAPKEKDARFLPCKLREYDGQKHCGVITPDGLQCTRSLTCKSHSLSLKRAVLNRGSYDDLLLAHRDAKEAVLRAKWEAQLLSEGKEVTQIPMTVIKSQIAAMSKGGKPKAAAVALTQKSPLPMLTPIIPPTERVIVTPDPSSRLSPEGEIVDHNDNLSYTRHPPKPAAVCTFGARRACNGSYIFGRKSDFIRAAFMSAVERHLHPPPHKKLCVESKLPKEHHSLNNSKDPYEFNTIDTSLLSQTILQNQVLLNNNRVPPKPKPKVTTPKVTKIEKSKPSYVITPIASSSTSIASTSSVVLNSVPSTAKRKRSTGNTANSVSATPQHSLPGNQISTTLVANFTLSNSGQPVFAIPNLNLTNTTLVNMSHNQSKVATTQKNNLLKDLGFVVSNRDTSINGAYLNMDNSKVYKTQIILDETGKQITLDPSKQFTIDPTKLNIDSSKLETGKQFTIDTSNMGKQFTFDRAKSTLTLDPTKHYTIDPRLNIDPTKVTIDTSKLNTDTTKSHTIDLSKLHTIDSSKFNTLDTTKIHTFDASKFTTNQQKPYTIDTSKLNFDPSKQFTIDSSKQFTIDPSKFSLDPTKFTTIDPKTEPSISTSNLTQRTGSYVTIGDNAYILDNTGAIPVSTILSGANRFVLHQAPKYSSVVAVNAASLASVKHDSHVSHSSLSTSLSHSHLTSAQNGLITSPPGVSIKAFPVPSLNHVPRLPSDIVPRNAGSPNLSLVRLEPSNAKKTGKNRGSRAKLPPTLIPSPSPNLTNFCMTPIAIDKNKNTDGKTPISHLFPLLSSPLNQTHINQSHLTPSPLTQVFNQSNPLTQVLGQSQSLSQAVLVTTDDLKSQSHKNVIT